MRTSDDEFKDGKLLILNGYDYENQAWIKNGVYIYGADIRKA